MKVRNGFVSNSSSSSFVLIVPDNFEEIMCGDSEELEELFDDAEEISVDVTEETSVDDGFISAQELNHYDESMEFTKKNYITMVHKISEELKNGIEVELFEGEYNENEIMEIIQSKIDKFNELWSFSTGPDNGLILLTTKKIINKKMEKK